MVLNNYALGVYEERSCAERLSSFTKPQGFDELVARYEAHFEASTTKRCPHNGASLLNSVRKIKLKETVSNINCKATDDHSDSGSGDEEEGPEESDDEDTVGAEDQMTVDKYGRAKKAKIAVKTNEDRNIFLKFKGFARASKYRIAPTNSMYVVDTSVYNHRISNSKKYNVISMNISGGVVVPNPEPVFAAHESDRPDRELITINVCDFESLYPKTMVFGNLCQSAAGYSAQFAVRVGNKLYNPFNTDMFNIWASPVKINDSYMAACVIIIKPTVKKSVSATQIEEVIKKRKEMKLKKKQAEERGDFITAAICDFTQMMLKLLINTLYGVFLTAGYLTYRPFLAALITHFGRMQLVRLLFSIFHYIQTPPAAATSSASYDNVTVDPLMRGPLGGDTDSLFFRCTPSEMDGGIRTFCAWPANRGVYAVEYERRMHSGIFLGKKNYILHRFERMEWNFATNAYAMMDREYCCKGAMKNSQSGPCRILCVRIFEAVFECFLSPTRDYALIAQKLETALTEYAATPDEQFRHKFKLRRDLLTYLKPNRVLKLLRLVGRPYMAGTDIEYTHYPYIFDEGPAYGPIGNDVSKMKYALRPNNRQCTALPADLYEMRYKELFEQKNIHPSKVRSMELDLKAVFDKIFDCLESAKLVEAGARFLHYFKAAFKKAFNSDYVTKKELTGRRAAKRMNADDEAKFDRAVARKQKRMPACGTTSTPLKRGLVVQAATLDAWLSEPKRKKIMY